MCLSQMAGEHKHFVKTHAKNCAVTRDLLHAQQLIRHAQGPLCPLGADATAQPAVAIP
jgi:hypothetical protein